MQIINVHRNSRKAAVWSLVSLAALLAVAGTASAQVLEEITVTAQKREVGLQESPLSITAYRGADLEKASIYSSDDLASQTAGLSFTDPTPFDTELNIRGVMNSRLDAPSASRSVGVFLDDVYVGRMGLMSMDFYDIERVEILRGPQGVLLGKNVVGGAINVISAPPEFETSGKGTMTIGNLNTYRFNGYLTGGLSDTIAARAAVQVATNDGYARDVLNNRDLHDNESKQARLSFLYQGENDLTARLIYEYLDDKGNGTCAIGENGNPWAFTRAFIGLTSIRECMPEKVEYSTSPEGRLQGYDRNASSLILNIDKGFDGFTFTSVTGYRTGDGESQYSQTGLGPDAPGVQDAFFAALGAGDIPTAINLGFAFDFPVRESENIDQFSQEFRFTSDTGSGPWDWIAGVYYQQDKVKKFDRFWSEILLGLLNPAVGGLSGESTWDNYSKVKSYAVFGQVGYQLTDSLKLTLGGRYTSDDVSGHVTGTAVALGDKFSPNDMLPLVPLTGEPDGMGGIIPYPEGGGFSTPYGKSWDKTTLQGILEWQATDAMMWYLSISTGYKAGGFQDTPPNTLGATAAYNPETVVNYEVGIKSDWLDGRMRLNGALFYMDYKDLQVEFTNDQCLCNIVSNASDARITGLELEGQLAATDSLLLWFSGSYYDTEYQNYVISTGDFSGNQLQRTPKTQVNAGFEFTVDAGGLKDALLFRLSYSWQDKMPWAHTNVSWEDSYSMVNGRISLAPPDRPWALSVWGKNLTDEDVRANVIEFLGGDVSLYKPPRTYGVDLSWRF